MYRDLAYAQTTKVVCGPKHAKLICIQ